MKKKTEKEKVKVVEKSSWHDFVLGALIGIEIAAIIMLSFYFSNWGQEKMRKEPIVIEQQCQPVFKSLQVIIKQPK